MNSLHLFFATLATLAILTGTASQYDPGVMETVVANRQAGLTAHDLPNPLPAVDGYIAVLDCEEIGNLWLVRPAGSTIWEVFLVADCAGDHLRPDGLTAAEWMLTNDILLELDYQTAVRWHTVGRGIEIEAARVELPYFLYFPFVK